MRPLDLLHISIADQCLYGFTDGQLVVRLPVSTALNGAGEQSGSNCTPRGRHQVRAKIGDGLPEGAVLRGRRWTGEVWSEALDAQFPGRDWILTRILWLSGCEPGRNRLGKVDTFRRYMLLLNEVAPRLPPLEIFWRVHFMLGAAAFSMSGIKALRAIAENDFGVDTSIEQVMRLMVPFLAAGMRAESGVTDEALANAQFKPRSKAQVAAKAV